MFNKKNLKKIKQSGGTFHCKSNYDIFDLLDNPKSIKLLTTSSLYGINFIIETENTDFISLDIDNFGKPIKKILIKISFLQNEEQQLIYEEKDIGKNTTSFDDFIEENKIQNEIFVSTSKLGSPLCPAVIFANILDNSESINLMQTMLNKNYGVEETKKFNLKEIQDLTSQQVLNIMKSILESYSNLQLGIISMELLEGYHTLWDVASSQEVDDESKMNYCSCSVYSNLRLLSLGYRHGDLHMSNIMVTNKSSFTKKTTVEGNTYRAIIIDFGRTFKFNKIHLMDVNWKNKLIIKQITSKYKSFLQDNRHPKSPISNLINNENYFLDMFCVKGQIENSNPKLPTLGYNLDNIINYVMGIIHNRDEQILKQIKYNESGGVGEDSEGNIKPWFYFKPSVYGEKKRLQLECKSWENILKIDPGITIKEWHNLLPRLINLEQFQKDFVFSKILNPASNISKEIVINPHPLLELEMILLCNLVLNNIPYPLRKVGEKIEYYQEGWVTDKTKTGDETTIIDNINKEYTYVIVKNTSRQEIVPLQSLFSTFINLHNYHEELNILFQLPPDISFMNILFNKCGGCFSFDHIKSTQQDIDRGINTFSNAMQIDYDDQKNDGGDNYGIIDMEDIDDDDL